jgi:hypothetical protein
VACRTANATTPIGRFTKKIQRQVSDEVKNPPSNGPITLASPNTAPKKPW